MSETLSAEVLLGMLIDTCDARDWALYIDYEPQRCEWRAQTGPAAKFSGRGGSLQQALADIWAQVMRYARDQATQRTRPT